MQLSSGVQLYLRPPVSRATRAKRAERAEALSRDVIRLAAAHAMSATGRGRRNAPARHLKK